MPRFARIPALRAFGLLLFFQSGNEFLFGGYVASFLTRETGMPVTAASYALAAYWAAIMLGRGALSHLALRVDPWHVVLAGAGLAAAGALVVAASPAAAVAVAGALLAGLALAGIFPAVLGLTGARFREHSGTVFGILFTVALCGGMTIPWLAGHLAEAAGLRAVFVFAALNFGAVGLLGAVARSRS
jgi:fucose permease